MSPLAALNSLNEEQLISKRDQFFTEYQQLKAQDLKLDLTRGKPASEQLDLTNQILDYPQGSFINSEGIDVRNYGCLHGIKEIREIFAPLLGVPLENLIAGGNASLEIMHDLIVFSLIHGAEKHTHPWFGQNIKFFAPSPGYDRHFALSESFGIELITIPMLDDGPDIEAMSVLAAGDASIKGVWIVPTYSNPTGVSISVQKAKELVSLPALADDFRIIWDNAYAIHTFEEQAPEPINILELAAAAGHPDRVWAVASTSKITYAGSGVSFFASSKKNLDWYLDHLSKRTIGPDKVNQLRHAQFFADADNVRAHMQKHRAILKPKFDLAHEILTEKLGHSGVAVWTKPEGGYFISLNVLSGTAKRVVSLAQEAGVKLTAAGSTFPYRNDPQDTNIRIAPSYPTVTELKTALEVVTTCVLLAASEKLLGDNGN